MTKSVCVQPWSHPDQTFRTNPIQPFTHLLFLCGQLRLVLDAPWWLEVFPAFSFKWWLRNPIKQATSLSGTLNIFRRVHILCHRKACISVSRLFSTLSSFWTYLPFMFCACIKKNTSIVLAYLRIFQQRIRVVCWCLTSYIPHTDLT